MICVNELTSLKCRNKEVLSQLVVVIAPFAPHLAEELWEALGHSTSVCDAQWPAFNEEYLKEDSIKYTISFNGKARFTLEFPADADNETIQSTVMSNEQAQKWIEGKTPKKVIIVPKKIVNIVL
jgi:leucyl-tRNA synthetase